MQFHITILSIKVEQFCQSTKTMYKQELWNMCEKTRLRNNNGVKFLSVTIIQSKYARELLNLTVRTSS